MFGKPQYEPIRIIARIFTVHTDEELDISLKDRLRATPCRTCLLVDLDDEKRMPCNGVILSTPHLTLDHERLQRDKRLLFEKLQRGEPCSLALS